MIELAGSDIAFWTLPESITNIAEPRIAAGRLTLSSQEAAGDGGAGHCSLASSTAAREATVAELKICDSLIRTPNRSSMRTAS